MSNFISFTYFLSPMLLCNRHQFYSWEVLNQGTVRTSSALEPSQRYVLWNQSKSDFLNIMVTIKVTVEQSRSDKALMASRSLFPVSFFIDGKINFVWVGWKNAQWRAIWIKRKQTNISNIFHGFLWNVRSVFIVTTTSYVSWFISFNSLRWNGWN